MSSSRGNDHQQRVLRYWWMLELFSPQQVPRSTRPARQPADRQVIEWQPSQPLPWEVLSEPRARDGRRRVWQHTVYLGVYDLQAVSERLQRKFAVDADAYDERPAGRSACAGLLVDERGEIGRASCRERVEGAGVAGVVVGLGDAGGGGGDEA